MLLPAAAAISRMPVATKPFSPKPRSAASMMASRVSPRAVLALRVSSTRSMIQSND